MKKIRLITAAFGIGSNKLVIDAPLIYKDYTVDIVFYNSENTPLRTKSLHPRLQGKIPKMMEWFDHPGYDYYIWIDSQFIVLEGFLAYMFQYESDEPADLFLFHHHKRSSVEKELEYMNDHMIIYGNQYLLHRYDGELINEQVNHYLNDENFIDDRLFSLGCFMYSKKLVENRDYNVMTDWLLHNVLYSVQDQLSLPYLLHKHKVSYKVYPDKLMENNILKHVWGNFDFKGQLSQNR